MEQLIEALKVALATSYSFQLKAHNYHWNVTGADFKQYHGLFGDIYEEVQGSIDPFAEEIRAMGSYTPGSLSRFSELTLIPDESVVPDALSMVSRLLTDAKRLRDYLTQTFYMSEEMRQPGLSDFLAGRIDAMNKHIWMLSATLGMSS